MAKRLNYVVGFSGDTSQLETAINSASKALEKLYNQPGHLSEDMELAAKAAADLSVKLKSAYDVSTGHLDLVNFNKSLNLSKKSLDDYITSFTLAGSAGQQAFIKVAQAIATAELPIRRTNVLLNELWTTMKNTMRWQLTSSMLHGFMGAVSTAYGYTKDLNESLNSIRIVTQKSAEDMAKFAEQANKAAKALSTTTTRYTDASLIYYQQGLDDEAVKARTDVTIKLANAAGESAETASEQLTAIWNNFAEGSKNLEHYADVLTALGASTASSTQEISQGLEKFAAIADTVGLSYEYAAAALATVTATTRQSADVVGTAFRTLFGRMESLKLGETLDDGTTLNKYSQALESVGVSIKNANGELKDMDDILDETMAKWGTLTRDQQVALSQTVAGVRQYSQFIALMDNAAFFQENLQTARNSEGVLEEQANIYAESWEAARDRVRAAAEDIYDSFIDEEGFITLDNTLSDILSRIADIVDVAGGLKGILTMLAPLMLTAFGPRIVTSMQNQVFNFQQSLGLNEAISKSIRERVLQELKDSKAISIENTYLREAAEVQNKLTVEYIELQDLILNNSDKLNEDTIKQTKALMDQIKAVQELSEKYSTLAQESFNKGSATAASLMDKNFKVYNKDFETLYSSKNYSSQRDSIRQVLGLPFNYSTKELINNFSLKNHSNDYRSRFYDLYYNKNEGLYQLANQKNSLIRNINSGNKSESELKQLNQDLEALSNKIETTTKNAKALGQALATAWPDLSGDIKEVSEAFDNFSQQAEDSVQVGTRPQKDIKNYQEVLEGLIETNDKWVNRITRVGNGLTALAMGITSITSLLNVLNDDSLSTAEKTTQILFSLGMLIPTITSGYTALRGVVTSSTVVQKVYNALMKSQSAEEIKGAFAKRVYARAEQLKTKAIEQGTIAVEAEMTATQAAKISTLAFLEPLIPFALVVGAAALAIYGLVKAYNADAEAAETAKKAHEEAAKTARETQQSYNDFLNLSEGYTKAIEKTRELTEGTEDYSNALNSANQQAEQLLEKYEQFNIKSRYKNGTLEIDQSELDRVQNALVNQGIAANTRSDITNIQAIRAQEKAQEIVLMRQLSRIWWEYDKESISKFFVDYYKTTGEIRQDPKEIDSAENNQAILDDWTKRLEESKPYIIDFGHTLEETSKIVQEAIKSIAESFLESIADFNNLTKKEQDFVSNVLAINIGENELEEARNQIRNKYLKEEESLVQGDYQTRTTYNREALLKDYQELGGIEENLSNQELLEYIQNVTAEGVALGLKEGLIENLENFFVEDSQVANVIETWVNNNMAKIDFSEISPALKSQLEGLTNEFDALLGEGATNNFVNQLKDYNVQDWINAQVAGAELLITKYQNAERVVSEALGTIAEGQKLEEEEITKLKDALASVEGADLTGFENLSVSDQIKELNKYLELITKNTEAFTSELESNSDQTEAFESAIKRINKALEQLTRDPWTVTIEGLDGFLDARDIAAKVGNIKKVIASINDDLTIDSDGIIEIGKRYPEILKDIAYDASKNVLTITQERYNQLKEYRDGDLEQYRDAAAKKLLADAQAEADIVKIIDLTEQAKQSSQSETFEKALIQSGINEEQIKAASQRIAIQVIDDEIEKLKAQKEQYLTTGSYSAATEKTISNQLQAVETNSKIAATNMQGYFITALKNTGAAFASWVTDPAAFGAKELRTALYKATNQQYSSGSIVNAEDVRKERTNDTESLLLQARIERLEKLKEQIKNGEEINFSQLTALLSLDAITQDQYGTLKKYVSGDYKGSVKNAAEAGLTSTTKDVANKAREEFLNVLDDLLGTTDKTKSGSGGSGSSKKLSDKDLERYHEITREIQRQSELLDKLGTQADRAYGVARLKEYEKELKNLEIQESLYRQKAIEAQSYLEKDRADLINLNSNFGLGIRFGASGDISNYTKMLTDLTTRYQNGGISEEDYDKIMSVIKHYEDSLDTRKENLQLAHGIAMQIQDKKLNTINYKIELALDIKDVKEQVNNISKAISESYGDAITHGLSVFKLDTSNALGEIEMVQKYQETAEELNALMDDWSTNTNDLVEAQKNLISNLGDSVDALLEWMNYWESMLPDAISAASERLNEFTDQLSHNTSILETVKELYALQGQTYKTAEGFRRLQQVSQERLNAQLSTAIINRNWFNELRANLEKAQAALDSLNGNENDVRWDAFKANRDALLAEYNAAEEAYLSSAKEAMESAKAMYEEQLEKAAYDFAQAVAGQDLDFLSERYDHFIDQEERYLDAVNTAYEKQSWYNRIQKDIDNDANGIYKDRLELFYQQEVEQRALNGLNKYDLDIIEAKYKVLQAQMALEEAQNNATEMRLVRNSQGNWTYRFSADPDAIADAEKNLADAQNDWYNIAKDQVTDVTGEIIKTWEEAQEAIKAIYDDMTLTDQERADKAAEIYDYYVKKIEDLEREKQIAIADMTEAGALTISNFQNTYAETLNGMTTSNQDFAIALQDYLQQCQDSLNGFNETVNMVAEESGSDLTSLDEKVKDIAESTENMENAGVSAAAALGRTITTIQNVALAYASLAEEVEAAYQAMRDLAMLQGENVEEVANRVEYDPNKDYSREMANLYQQYGASAFEREDFKQLERERQAKIDRENIVDALTNEQIKEMLLRGFEGIYFTLEEYRRIMGLATGGYTGAWGPSGKLALLHEKELVLNQEDTANILAATEIMRAIVHTLDNGANMATGNMAALLTGGRPFETANSSVATTNYFNVSFPNAVYASEIEEALNSLISNAEQYASDGGV